MSDTDVEVAQPSGVPYHISQQYAAGLLSPLLRQLQALEERAANYLEHLRLTGADRQALQQTYETLRQASAQIAQLAGDTVAESTEQPRTDAGSPRSPSAAPNNPR